MPIFEVIGSIIVILFGLWGIGELFKKPSLPYYVFPIGGYYGVYHLTSQFVIQYIDPDLWPIGIIAAAVFAEVTHLKFWGFVDIAKAAVVLNILTGSTREVMAGWNPLIPGIEYIRPKADRDLSKKTIAVSVTIPTRGKKIGETGPEITIAGVITTAEVAGSHAGALTYDEEQLREGAEALVKSTVQKLVGQIPITKFAARWGHSWELEVNGSTQSQKPLMEEIAFAFTKGAKRSTFEKRYGQKVIAADFSYKNSDAQQESAEKQNASRKVIETAHEIQVKGGIKKVIVQPGYEDIIVYNIAWEKAMRDAKVLHGLIEEKHYSGTKSPLVIDNDTEGDNRNKKRR